MSDHHIDIRPFLEPLLAEGPRLVTDLVDALMSEYDVAPTESLYVLWDLVSYGALVESEDGRWLGAAGGARA